MNKDIILIIDALPSNVLLKDLHIDSYYEFEMVFDDPFNELNMYELINSINTKISEVYTYEVININNWTVKVKFNK